jgi:predicted transcriptional regulator of viral defense system
MANDVAIPKDQKIFSIRELKGRGLSLYKIGKLVKSGDLIKLNKSHYENARYIGEENDFYYVAAYAPHGVICLLSAAAYYNLTTYVPDAIDAAIPRKSKASLASAWPAINVRYYTNERYNLGMTTVREGKNQFKIYDLEKTVVDVVSYREKVGIEETKEILTTYLRRKDRNLNRLLKYAQQTKCDGTLRLYLEALL